MHLPRWLGRAGTRRPKELPLLLRQRYISVWHLGSLLDRVSVVLSRPTRGTKVSVLLVVVA